APVPPEVLRTRSGLALLQAIVAGDLPMPRIADVLPFALSEVNHIKVHPRIAAGLPQGRDRLVALSPDRLRRPPHHPRTSWGRVSGGSAGRGQSGGCDRR